MHIQEGKPNKKASKSACGPKHVYCGGKYEPKHAQEETKHPAKGIGAFVVAVFFAILTVVFREYAFLTLPLAVVSTVLSICAVSRRKTGFSVIALILSIVASVLAVILTALAVTEFFTGFSVASFLYFS